MGADSGTTALLSRLAENPTGGPPFLAELRRTAAARLRETGLPTRKVEGWRFTPLSTVVGTPFEAAPESDAAESAAFVAAVLGDDGTHRVLLSNGRPVPGISGAAPAGVTVEGLAALLAADPGALEPHLGSVAPAEHFAALNAASLADGLVLRIAEGARPDRPIHIVHVGEAIATPGVAHPRLLVLAGAGSEAEIVETYLVRPGERHLTNAVTELILAEGARLDHTRAVQGEEHAFHFGTVAVRQAAGSAYTSHVVTLGGAMSRLDLVVRFAGEGAACTLNGVYHAMGDEHVDHRTLVDHASPGCESHETYRGLVDGRGRAVFDGTMVVRRDAQRSSAHQENRNLLLSDDAVVNTKPHLEIDADDVKASHGATVGALDDAQLFYLRSRGIEESEARDMLIFAFVEALLERIPHEPVARRLGEALLHRLPHGDLVREMLT